MSGTATVGSVDADRQYPDDFRCQLDAALVSFTAGRLLDALGPPSDAFYGNAAKSNLRLVPTLPNDYVLCVDAARALQGIAQVAFNAGRLEQAKGLIDGADLIRQRIGQPPLQIQTG